MTKAVGNKAVGNKAVGAAVAGNVGAALGAPTSEESKVKYSKVDLKKIKTLQDAEVELTGEESPEELDTLIAALSMDEGDAPTEAEEVDGVPNKLPIRTEDITIANKPHKLPIFFVAAVKGGKQALYDYQGKRVSPAYGPEDVLPGSENSSSPTKALGYINKAAAKFNAMRRKNIIPGEAQIG